MFSTIKVALIGVTLCFCFSVGYAQQAQTLTPAVQLIGLAGLKENTKGNLTFINGSLRFVHAKGNADVAATSIENVVTGTDSQRAIGGTLGTLTQLAPFGSGRVLSLFRTKLDTLTIAGNAKLDLADNRLILTGASVAAVEDAIAVAYDYSAWDGPGITTTMPDAAGGLTTLAVASASQILHRRDRDGPMVGAARARRRRARSLHVRRRRELRRPCRRRRLRRHR